MKITSAALFISIALVVFGICYYYFTTRHRERMAILHKGLPKDYFKGNDNYLPLLLTLGIVSIGIALGVVFALFLNSLGINVGEPILFLCSIFLFLGISLLVSYRVLKRIHENR